MIHLYFTQFLYTFIIISKLELRFSTIEKYVNVSNGNSQLESGENDHNLRNYSLRILTDLSGFYFVIDLLYITIILPRILCVSGVWVSLSFSLIHQT